MQVDRVYGFGRRIRLVRVLRWVLVAFSLALATVLLLRHDYVIGSLIAVLVAVRIAILVGTTRRRRPYMRMNGSVAQPGASTPQPGVSSAASGAASGRPLAGL